ncbi:MAG TPA: hypothetical protein VK728_11140 [Candidatus Sulfotelmatobacter sp.]|jgi:hypothetical protein|nr:hypothetical protein [Candidatus Sulfotelmatobacter sp.]
MPTNDPSENRPGRPNLPNLPAPNIEYREFGGGSGAAAAATPAEGTPKTEAIAVTSGPHGRTFSMDTEDIVAIGAVILCIGGLLAAVVVAVGLVLGKVQGSDATKIIIGCVGGSAIAAILGKAAKKSKEKKTP